MFSNEAERVSGNNENILEGPIKYYADRFIYINGPYGAILNIHTPTLSRPEVLSKPPLSVFRR